MSEPSTLLVSVTEQDGIARIVINRPKMNALNRAVLDELAQAVRAVSRRGGPRVAVLSGAGDRAFVAGADIGEMSTMTPAEAREFAEAGHTACRLIEEAPCPFIAAVQGYALGGGCELALACDFIYASENAEFGQPEVNLGLMPGFGGTQRLTRRVGAGWARQLIYTGEYIKAAEAQAIGLVNRVVPAGELEKTVLAIAAKIAQKGPLGVAASKRAILRGAEIDLVAGCELEARAFAVLFGSEDQKEGTRAFLEKRSPVFKGR
jgi:enoyl-CoA hydratase